jgi:hypothetical protein
MEPENIVRLTARTPQVMGRMESRTNIAVPDRVIEARAAATTNCGDSACEKPVSNTTFTLPIILGVA